MSVGRKKLSACQNNISAFSCCCKKLSVYQRYIAALFRGNTAPLANVHLGTGILLTHLVSECHSLSQIHFLCRNGGGIMKLLVIVSASSNFRRSNIHNFCRHEIQNVRCWLQRGAKFHLTSPKKIYATRLLISRVMTLVTSLELIPMKGFAYRWG